MKSFEAFSDLHQNSTPLLLGNIWDVNSAVLFENVGYKALGTSSQAVAKSMGYEDGENLPFESLLQLAKRVTRIINVPFTVDIEAGFSRNVEGIVENVKKLHDLGVVGVNLEDSIPGALRQIRPLSEFQFILSAVAERISQNNLDIFLNIRTDGFLLGMPNALAETLARTKAYQEFGANGIFVPCITAKEDINKVVKATHLPVNVMCMPQLPGFDELKTLGVKRISMGPFLNNLISKKTEEAIRTILRDKNFSSFF